VAPQTIVRFEQGKKIRPSTATSLRQVLEAANEISLRLAMEQYDDTFEAEEAPPSIQEIEKHLRKLGCTKEQVRRHIEHVTQSRTEPVNKKRGRNRPHKLDWP